MGPVSRRAAVVCVVILAHLALPLLLRDACGSDVAEAARGDSRWSYLANADVRLVARSISLSEDRPEEFTEEVDYRGSLQRYAQLRYGSENSRRVVLVVDELDDGEFRLFVDADRDRRITAGEIVVGHYLDRYQQIPTNESSSNHENTGKTRKPERKVHHVSPTKLAGVFLALPKKCLMAFPFGVKRRGGCVSR